MIRRAVLEQHAELVAAQAGERIALAQALEQHGADLAYELIAGGVAAGVVDHFELVQIEIHHHVVPAELRGALEREAEALLEFGAIYQAGQGVVARLVGKPGGVQAQETEGRVQRSLFPWSPRSFQETCLRGCVALCDVSKNIMFGELRLA